MEEKDYSWPSFVYMYLDLFFEQDEVHDPIPRKYRDGETWDHIFFFLPQLYSQRFYFLLFLKKREI